MKYNACLWGKRSEREKEEAEKLEIQHWILAMGKCVSTRALLSERESG